MGKTNRKKFQDLLDEVSNNTQQYTPDRDFQNSFTTDENTFQEEQEDNLVFDDSEDESLTTKNRVPSMNWEAKSQLQIGKRLVLEATKCFNPVNGQVPRQTTPNLEETCLFVPVIKGAVNRSGLSRDGFGVGDNQVNAADWVSKDYLMVDGRFHKIKLYASILESYNIPWAVSKYKLKIRTSDDVFYKVAAIIDCGVIYTGNNPSSELEWEVRHHLEQTTDSTSMECHYAEAEHTHEKNGVYYFPIGSNERHVYVFGVFNNSSLMNHSTSHNILGAEHMDILKKGSRS